MRLLLMRHGATLGNEQRRYVGCRTDEPLSELGRAQCAQAGTFSQIEKVYVSPMLRAQQTARICFPQARLHVVPGLQEIDFGVFEGKSAQEMECDEAYRAWVDSGCEDTCPGGESHAAYVARSNAALLRVLYEAVRRSESQMLVVAHGGTIMAALSAYAWCGPQVDAESPDDNSYFRWHVGNCEGYEADVHLDGATMRLLNPMRFTRIPL